MSDAARPVALVFTPAPSALAAALGRARAVATRVVRCVTTGVDVRATVVCVVEVAGAGVAAVLAARFEALGVAAGPFRPAPLFSAVWLVVVVVVVAPGVSWATPWSRDWLTYQPPAASAPMAITPAATAAGATPLRRAVRAPGITLVGS
ncbi:hypothetical protein DJ021_11070 [Phenylobacterium hankyongense]|uniref:Uncharacterized protein n=1 Tax=Phenylobacterium hankyongense TaxID=1813876 RepID=A0A328B5I8_9CAUL|nr:hypothetical protein DJ021_11070 [Phenylobacterium hankyongense]